MNDLKTKYFANEWDLTEKEIIEEYLDDYPENADKDEDKLSDLANDWMYEEISYEWEDLVMMMKDFDHDAFVIRGVFQAWNGPHPGGYTKIGTTLDYIVTDTLLDDSHFSIGLTEDGIFTIYEYHHDSPCKPNHYEIKYLTKSGISFVNKNEDRLSRQELVETVFNDSEYSKNIDLDK